LYFDYISNELIYFYIAHKLHSSDSTYIDTKLITAWLLRRST